MAKKRTKKNEVRQTDEFTKASAEDADELTSDVEFEDF